MIRLLPRRSRSPYIERGFAMRLAIGVWIIAAGLIPATVRAECVAVPVRTLLSGPSSAGWCSVAQRAIDPNLGVQNANSFHHDLPKTLRPNVLANPPFNDSDWGGERLRERCARAAGERQCVWLP